jgi:hypothetical protein
VEDRFPVYAVETVLVNVIAFLKSSAKLFVPDPRNRVLSTAISTGSYAWAARSWFSEISSTLLIVFRVVQSISLPLIGHQSNPGGRDQHCSREVLWEGPDLEVATPLEMR